MSLTNLVTSETFEAIAVLALEQIHDEAIVPHLVDLPLLLRSDFWRERLECRLAFRCQLDRCRLVLDPIKILV